ncbi:hypothetical protein ABB37_05783 [Leptomonas pyrrhocoris]|uniref:Uncharacterized protein n=1 Tax=Leptomonas pyrrhocoris TaxID=157538 RepID=A0A0N0VEZ8_LEPPY|nr:hypothetical protein ABB37_05783 [Leptomonas pyrrhocoris]KPA79332.1 hypothetical protein ABB37_05783 [Leptomonas pyrrhocoris]|eukprot:XP_015657771.1 hypothetical protein ABB37_05783 [Leptomonas pyrrhocoris]
MKKAQEERNELLRYALQHPPPNVVVKLPKGFDSFDNIDLALCPSPLPLYAEAEKAAANAKGGKAPQFHFDMKGSLTFVGGSSGGVQRATPSAGSSRTKRLKSPRDGHSSPEAKPETSSPGHGQRTANDGTAAASASPPAESQQRIVASEQSPPHPANAHISPSTASSNGGNNATPEPEQSKGFFAHIVGTFRGLNGADPQQSNSSPNTRAAPARTQRILTRSPTAIKQRSVSGSSGIFGSFLNPFSTARVARNSSQGASAASPHSEDSGSPDTARRMEQLQIPLCGSTPATMSEAITRQFGPVFDAVDEHRRARATALTAAKEFPKPPNIQLCEVLNSAPVAAFLDVLPIFAYDNLVMCASVLTTKKRDVYDAEMRNVYRRVFNISEEQHRRILANVTPPALKAPFNEADPAAVAERRRYIAGFRGDAKLLRLLCEESTDDDYVARTEQLLYCIENFPDSPGDALVPFAVRAMVYAACLMPLYQLDLSTLSPIYTEKDVEHCLALLRSRMGISSRIEKYCHLHAQLLANDQCGSVEAQAVFLKGVARAVSSLGARDIADSQLTPPVKYAYYVLQESFCLAAVPMPWLDSTFSYDMQRSVSAVFIETCLALPSCMLSAMVLVEDMQVLPPTEEGEAFLLAFMEVFVNSGVFRNYAELVDEDADSARAPSSGSAAVLLQQVNSGLDTQQKAYCKMLTRSFPLAMFLLVPGRLRIGAYILLVRHWGNAYPGAHHEVPSDFQAAMSAYLLYLLGSCGGDKWVGHSPQLSSLLVRCTQTYLAPFSVLAKDEEASFASLAQQQLEKLQPQWAATLDDATQPPSDVLGFLRTVFDTPRPPPLGSDPSSQHHVRLVSWAQFATALLRRCMEGVPRVAPASSNAKTPYIAAEYERIHRAAALRNANEPLLPGAVHRLHTVVRLKEVFCECLSSSHRTYELVRSVSGAPTVGMTDIQEEHSQSVYDAVLQLCDTISIETLSNGTVKDLFAKFMRLDTKQYQAMKQNHGKNEDFPMPRAFPEVTMGRIIEEIQQATAVVCARLDYEPAVRQVHYRVGHNFVAYLFAVYVDGAGVFLSTADAPLILADLDLVRVAFFETNPDPSPVVADVDVVSTACKAVAHAMRTSGAELLEKLYGIVQYIMSRPSSELINGGAGVPPLHTLPESSEDSPWCQYVVRRVLEHRKDSKWTTWINYQTRQRTKTMY